MPIRSIIWTKKAARQFATAINYIHQESPQNAKKVREIILEKISQLSSDILVHRQDPYKYDNDGSFLYFEVLKYRVVYRVVTTKVYIIRVRHTGMEPKLY